MIQLKHKIHIKSVDFFRYLLIKHIFKMLLEQVSK